MITLNPTANMDITAIIRGKDNLQF